jgi:hypothetical protein
LDYFKKNSIIELKRDLQIGKIKIWQLYDYLIQ